MTGVGNKWMPRGRSMQGHASETFWNEEDIIHAGKEGERSAQGKRVITLPSPIVQGFQT